MFLCCVEKVLLLMELCYGRIELWVTPLFVLSHGPSVILLFNIYMVYENVVGWKSQKLIFCFCKIALENWTIFMTFHFSTLTCFCRRSQIKVLVEQSVFSSIIILEICCHMKANTKTFWFLNARDRTLKFSVKMNPFKG